MLPTYIFFSIFLDKLILKNFLKNKTNQALRARLQSQIAWTFFLLCWFFLFFLSISLFNIMFLLFFMIFLM